MLYAPKIENILPAFSTDPQNPSNVLITIPYQLNLSVGYEDFTHIKYIIKTATTNTEISFSTDTSKKQQYNAERQSYVQNLSLPKNKFTEGQYYKIQIAFVDGNDVGYFSNVGVSKYIKKPTITINHKNIREIVATFTDAVTYEKVYKYKFDLYDSYGNILETSEEQVHNSLNDTNPTTSVDTWEIKTTLNSDIKYVVKYSVTTASNYEIIKTANLTYQETILPRLENCFLVVKNNFDEGYNKIYLEMSLGDNKVLNGNFILLRSSSKYNYEDWEQLVNFQIYEWNYDNGNNPIFNIYKDYLIEQGVSYQYAIQAYNSKGIYSAKMINIGGPVYADFEDVFLYDGIRQLKIRYNAKVSSFKSNILETKIDTIGSKYPHFFRNGTVQYKELGLSGLISLTQDSENEFSLGEFYYHPYPDESYNSLELTSYNFQREREFKNKVLEWLMNGKEKVLKTAGEGNYIVRLMNSSLSPTDTLGRMLHSFTSTAYEVFDYNFTNLKNLKFIDQSQTYSRKTIEKELVGKKNSTINLDNSNYVKIDQATLYSRPDKKFVCILKDGSTISGDDVKTDSCGVAVLDAWIQDIGLKAIKTEDSSWPKFSTIQYSYQHKCEDTSDWYYVEKINKSGKETLNGKVGQGTDKSMKEYVTKKSSTNNTQNVISHFAYVEISKIEPEKTKTTAGYYDMIIPDLYESYTFSNLKWEKDDDGKDTTTPETVIFRNIPDFRLGKGLTAKIITPLKELKLRAEEPEGVRYAI